MEVGLSLPAGRVIRTLNQIFEYRLVPNTIRCDNGPEFTSHEFQNWVVQKDIKIEYIQPGKPQQNAYIERYNRTVRYGLLNQYLFNSLNDIQDYATRCEPTRVFRRQFILSHATLADSSNRR